MFLFIVHCRFIIISLGYKCSIDILWYVIVILFEVALNANA